MFDAVIGTRLPEEPVDFSVLGPFQIRRAGVILAIPGQPDRQLLGTLLRYARQPVPVDLLVGAVWPDRPPANAVRQVHAELALLRQLIGGPHGTLVIDPSGTVTAEVQPAHLDASRFLALLAAAEESARSDDLPAATRQVCDALHQWRGPALTDVHGALRDEWVGFLNEQRLYAVELRFDVELCRGRHSQAVAELTELVEKAPARAHLTGLLMLALHGSGHLDDALRLYERTRQDPNGPVGNGLARDLASVRDAVLRADAPLRPALRPRPDPRQARVPGPAGGAVPEPTAFA